MPSAKPNDLDIAGLRELEAKATAGPWKDYFDPHSNDMGCVQSITSPGGHLCAFTDQKPQQLADAAFVAAIRNAAPALLAIAEIGQAVQKIRPDEWEYFIKVFENGNDRQWAIACEIRKALLCLARKDG